MTDLDELIKEFLEYIRDVYGEAKYEEFVMERFKEWLQKWAELNHPTEN